MPTKQGFALDMKQTGFGLIELGHHASAVHADPLTDNLYLVIDSTDGEPDSADLPIVSNTPIIGSGPIQTIYQFDAETGSGDLNYRFKSKMFLLPYPACFRFCQVKADSFDNIVLNAYADGQLFHTEVVASEEPFGVPMLDEYNRFEFEIIGTSTVRSVQFVEDIRELN